MYTPLTETQYQALTQQIDAWLSTPIKNYAHGVELYARLHLAGPATRAFHHGQPERYLPRLTQALQEVRKLTRYPRLITTTRQRDALYIATLTTPPDGHELPLDPTTPATPTVAPNDPTVPTVPNDPEAPTAPQNRPHLDTYIDTLPADLQARARQIPSFYLNLQSLHAQLKRLDSQNALPEAIAPVTRAIDRQQQQLTSLWREIDNLRAGPAPEPPDPATPRRVVTKQQIDTIADPVQQALAKKRRIDSNLKYLRRRDLNPRKANPEITLRTRELLEWNIPDPNPNPESNPNPDPESPTTPNVPNDPKDPDVPKP
jgi:hypothetical protein